MSFSSDLTGLDRLVMRARKLERPDATPLMVTWQNIIVKDNRDGVLKGTDKDGAPMMPVKYRPVHRVEKLTLAQRNTGNARQRTGRISGFGPASAGLHNNLTSREYRKLDGPPLAPRRQFSRVITNLVPGYIEPQGNSAIWAAVGTWKEVVSVKGVQFLPFHFDGAGRLPRRDLAGVRPEGRAEARRTAINWLRLLVRGLPISARDVA